MKLKTKRLIGSTLVILLGNFLLAVAIACFVLPNKLLVGGVTGISLIVKQFLPVNTAVTVACINIVLFCLGALVLGKRFALTTILSTFTFPLFLSLLQSIPALSHLTDNIMLSAVCAGLLVGAAIALVVRNGASSGGMDIPPLILNRLFGIPVSVSIYCFDAVIILGQARLASSEKIIFGILTLLITSITIDKVMLFGKTEIQLLILSPKFEEIRRTLLEELDTGATLLMAETAFAKKEQKAVLCVVSQRRLRAVTDAVQHLDPEAFITISHVSEVRGRGFSLERMALPQKPKA